MKNDNEFADIPTEQLVEMAYDENVDDRYWQIISEMRLRGSDVEFRTSKNLINSPDPINKQIGAHILSQLDAGKNTYHDQAVDALIPLLYDSSEDVIEVAAFGLGHRHDVKSIPHLLKLINHENNVIRHGVALGLSCLEEENAIQGLIKLSNDENFETRNWATFGLAQQCDTTSPEILKALQARLKDPEPEIRGEALIGLARRKAPDVNVEIMQELKGKFFGTWAVYAAEITGASEFLSVLKEIKKAQKNEVEAYMLSQIEDAIQSCSN